MRRLTLPLLPVSVLLVLVLTVLLPTAGAAKAPRCLIVNDDTASEYTSLAAAVDDASPYDQLLVQGICTGTAELPIPLTITGQEAKGFQKPALVAGGAGPVLSIHTSYRGLNASVTVNSLTIEGATSGSGIEVDGHAYDPQLGASLILHESTVRDNSGTYGGGIHISGGKYAYLTLGESTVTGNTATYGGGIYSYGAITSLADSTVSDNTAVRGGGIRNVAYGGPYGTDGRLTLNGTTVVRDNHATYGGGIDNAGFAASYPYLGRTGLVTLNDTSKISHNQATFGGGVYNGDDTLLSMTTTNKITDNQAATSGGGIYNTADAVNDGCYAGVNVAENIPDDIYTELPPP